MTFPRNFLVCLTGLPSSGKSTLARRLKQEILKQDPRQEIKIIDPDIIRTKLTGDMFDPEKEDVVRKKNLKAIEKALKKGKIVISDDLNYYSSMRHELREIADNLNLPFFIIYISTPLETCIEWNVDRGLPIPNEVIYKINNKFDYFEKYEWDTPDLVINPSKGDDLTPKIRNFLIMVRKEFQKLRTKGDSPPHPIKNHHDEYAQKLDILTRETVSELLKEPHNREVKSKILAARKHFIKKNLDKAIQISKIPEKFKKFLKKQVDTKLTVD